jgi:abortive infection bacteriophage resistance protein
MYQYPKNFLSVTQLVQKLKDAGMTINSQDEAEVALTTIGYYRLKSYSFHRIDPTTKKYTAPIQWLISDYAVNEVSSSN